jgi:hypothetical protein
MRPRHKAHFLGRFVYPDTGTIQLTNPYTFSYEWTTYRRPNYRRPLGGQCRHETNQQALIQIKDMLCRNIGTLYVARDPLELSLLRVSHR